MARWRPTPTSVWLKCARIGARRRAFDLPGLLAMATPDASVRRFADNPILVASQIQPSRPDFEVVGVFNPGAIRIGDETVLLLRVAEAPLEVAPHQVASPIFNPASQRIELLTWSRDTPGLKLDDSRLIVVGRDTFLTSISHFRRARSKDGLHFEVEAEPVFSAQHALAV